jgi:hypothetical protein
VPRVKGAHLRLIHALLTIVWILLVVPTMVWWRQSIFWVSLMSIYAIIVSHWTAWQAARAEVAASPETE